MSDFIEFPKMARLTRECIITEKIDGTNAQIAITEDGVMLGYTVVEDFGPHILITSLVVGEPYRTGKATWLLFKKILEVSEGRQGVYIPIHEDMWASKLCVNGRIDRERAEQWVKALSKKWS